MRASSGLKRRLTSPRFLFQWLAGLFFIILPLLSLNSGISGDEPVHYKHAEFVHLYFSTNGKDTSALNTPETNLKHYGQVIDNISYNINRIIKPEDPYRSRHILVALIGAGTLLLAGLFAVDLAGFWAGIIAMIFLFVSPRFLGHSFNNLKDIPFAFAYLLAIYSLIRFIKPFPIIRWQPLLGLLIGMGLALAIRPGGLLLFPITCLFIALQAILKRPSPHLLHKTNLSFFLYLLLITSCLVPCAFFLGILDWPYALQKPFVNPFDSLATMTSYEVSLRQVFEGSLSWSEDLPWYYAPKYLFITTPTIILAGLLLIPILAWRRQPVRISLLAFAIIFPLIWIIVRNANLYGAIRHLLFIYPLITISSAVAWLGLCDRIKRKSVRYGFIVVLIFGVAMPLLHIIRNHPVEYVYFNRLSGGIENAYGKYETDYYFHSLGPSITKLNAVLEKNEKAEPIILASNFPLEAYRPRLPNGVQFVYTPFSERSKFNWDYGLFVNAYITPGQIHSKAWPSNDTMFIESIDNYPMCVVLQQKKGSFSHCREVYLKGEYDRSVRCFRTFITHHPEDALAHLYLGWCYHYLGSVIRSNLKADAVLYLHPESEPARILKGNNHLVSGNFEETISIAEEVIQINRKFKPAYLLAAQAADSLGEFELMRKYLGLAKKY